MRSGAGSRDWALRLGSIARPVHTGNKHAAINRLDGAGMCFVEGFGDFVNVAPDDRPIDCGHDQDGKWTSFEPLLLAHVFVAGEENLKAFALDERQQFAIFYAAPLHTHDSMNFMPRQKQCQLSQYVLIEENLQGRA